MIGSQLCWQVGDQRYYNQIETWQAIERTGADYRFCLFEKAYDRYDWTQDPALSWEELLRLRCIQLRERYHNLKMLFSGGRDSTCALRSFAANGVPLDELLIVDYRENPIRHKEFLTWIKPQAERYQQVNPQVKITTLTVDFKDYNDWYNEDWTQTGRGNTLRGYFQPSDYTWMIQRQLGREHSNTGIINGLEKPTLRVMNGGIYATQIDQCFLHYFNNPDIMEFFYLTPDLPELHIKQCHMAVNHLVQYYPDANSDFVQEFQRPGKYYDEFCLSIGRGPAVDVTNPAQNGKNKYLGSHPVFKILARAVKNSEYRRAWDRYEEQVRWVQDQTPNAFFDTNDRLHWGHKPILGKLYFIREWNQHDQETVTDTQFDAVL
jgi:hypothetical protein